MENIESISPTRRPLQDSGEQEKPLSAQEMTAKDIHTIRNIAICWFVIMPIIGAVIAIIWAAVS